MTARTLVIVAAALAALGAARAAHAADLSGAEVVKARGCLNCHDATAKKIGPSFKEVAAKYANRKDAAATIVAKLKDGTGHMKVPASDNELVSAVHYVLSQK